MALDTFYTALSERLDGLAPGGAFLVDPGTYGVVPYGWKGVITLLMMAGLEFDIAEGAIRAVKVRRGRKPQTILDVPQTFVSYITSDVLMWIESSSRDAHPNIILVESILYGHLDL